MSLVLFKRHVHKKHFPNTLLLNSQTSDESSSNSLLLSTSNEDGDGNNVINNIQNNISKVLLNFNLISESVYKLAVEFILNLYNSNNFTRVEIINVQNGIIKNIIKSVVSFLKQWI